MLPGVAALVNCNDTYKIPPPPKDGAPIIPAIFFTPAGNVTDIV